MKTRRPHTPPDLVDIFNGADPDDDPPGSCLVQCEICGCWTPADESYDEQEVICRSCHESYRRHRDSVFSHR